MVFGLPVLQNSEDPSWVFILEFDVVQGMFVELPVRNLVQVFDSASKTVEFMGQVLNSCPVPYTIASQFPLFFQAVGCVTTFVVPSILFCLLSFTRICNLPSPVYTDDLYSTTT